MSEPYLCVSRAEMLEAQKWLRDVIYPVLVKRQQESYKGGWFKKDKPVPEWVQDCWDGGIPYLGAIGGGLSYMLHPTSIGVVTKAVWDGMGLREELDLTDYSAW